MHWPVALLPTVERFFKDLQQAMDGRQPAFNSQTHKKPCYHLGMVTTSGELGILNFLLFQKPELLPKRV